jgi:hypothetical protein
MTSATIRLLAGAACVALVASAPARATTRVGQPAPAPAPVQTVAQGNDLDHPPVDKNGKKYCPILGLDGEIAWEPHGSTITLTWPNHTSRTNICDDGACKNARLAPGASIQAPVGRRTWTRRAPSRSSSSRTAPDERTPPARDLR